MPVCLCSEERHKLLGIVAPVHVQGEQTAVLAADLTCQALQLSFVKISGRAVPPENVHDFGHERYDAVGIKLVGLRRFGSEMHG